MNSTQQYQKALDKAFSKKFKKWDEVSPFDPLKVFTEALSASLSEIEHRQNRYMETVLDAFPSLLSFHPKPALLPEGLFEFKLSAKQSEPYEIGPDHAFRIESEAPVALQPTSKTTLFPWSDFKQSQEGTKTALSFHTQGSCDTITLHFLPEETTLLSSTLDNIHLRVTNQEDQQEQVYEWDQLLIDNRTEGFTNHGLLKIKPKDKKNGFAATSALIELSISTSKPLQGSFYTNLVKCTLFSSKNFLSLGYLKNEPWQNVPLPDFVIESPHELLLQFPDDHSRRLVRIDSDLLKLKHANPERFANAFFYCGTNHSLIIPNAHSLMQTYQGGVSIVAPEVIQKPVFPSLNKDTKIMTGDYAHLIEQVTHTKLLSPFVNREAKEEFLRRFYSSVRNFNTTKNASTRLIPAQLKDRILSSDDTIRSVEIDVDSTEKTVRVFVLTGEMNNNEVPAPTRKALAELQARIENWIPIEFAVQVRPFFHSNLFIRLLGRVRLNEKRMGIISQGALKSRIEQSTEHILMPPPYGPLVAQKGISNDHLFEWIQRRLLAAQFNNTQLKANEIEKLNGWFAQGENLEHLDMLVRRPGEVFNTKLDVEVHIETEVQAEILKASPTLEKTGGFYA